MSKDLIRGFLLAHNAPKEVMDALGLLGEPVKLKDSLPVKEREREEILDKLDVSVRVMNCLKSYDYKYIDQIIDLPASELLKIPGMGRKSLKEFTIELLEKGYKPYFAGRFNLNK